MIKYLFFPGRKHNFLVLNFVLLKEFLSPFGGMDGSPVGQIKQWGVPPNQHNDRLATEGEAMLYLFEDSWCKGVTGTAEGIHLCRLHE